MKYVLKTELIRELQKKTGWTVLRISEETVGYFESIGVEGKRPISERTIRNALDGNPVDLTTALAVAHVFETDLSIIEWARVAPWEASPPRRKEYWSTDWSKGLKMDMSGDHENAIAVFDDVLGRLPDDIALPIKLELLVQRGIAIDQAGQHEEAAKEFRSIIDAIMDVNPYQTGLLFSAKYHLGIALRRQNNFDDAEVEFLDLLKLIQATANEADQSHPFEPSVLHQLGVLSLCKAKGCIAPERKTFLQAAIENLQLADEKWAFLFENAMPADGHRRGYTLRRLGEAHAELGDQHLAAHFFFEAVSILSWYRCDRYIEETRQLYRTYILDQMK